MVRDCKRERARGVYQRGRSSRYKSTQVDREIDRDRKSECVCASSRISNAINKCPVCVGMRDSVCLGWGLLDKEKMTFSGTHKEVKKEMIQI